MQINYLAQARQDLVEIADHYREVGGHSLATKLLHRVRDDIVLLKTMPQAGSNYPLLPGIRRLVIVSGAFLVFYRVNQAVEILHIRRSEREPLQEHELH